MELIPHGIGSISLGMSPAQVESILGRHHTYEEWMGGNLNGSLLYPGIVISFNHSDGSGPLDASQASEIWIHSTYPTTLAGQDVFSLYKVDIENLLNAKEVDFESVNDIWVREYGWEFCFDENKQVIAIYINSILKGNNRIFQFQHYSTELVFLIQVNQSCLTGKPAS